MLARLQKIITLGLLAFALAWAAGAFALGCPAWAPGGAALIALGYGLFMAAEFAILWWVHSDRDPPRPTAGQLLRAWWGEVSTAPRIFCWQQPFASRRHPDHLPAGASGRGVLLVHGFVCNRGFWNRWMPRLQAAGVPFMAVDLEPVFGSIDLYAERLEPAVRRLEQLTGLPPVIVCHSMGGLAARAWMARHGGAARVHRVVTIGSPHHGTWTARYGTTANAREMRSDSVLLRSLAQSEAAHGYDRFTCFYSHCDNIVYPASTATLPGADNRHVPGVAHVQLMDHPAVFSEVLKLVVVAFSR
jgi:triacylglycerol lipase